MKKVLIAMLAAAMLAGTMTGCNGNNNNSGSSGNSGGSSQTGSSAGSGGGAADNEDGVNPAGVFPIVNDPITLSLFVESDMTEKSLADLETNNPLKYIEETTNINLEFTFLNYSAEGKQKMVLAFASNNYPDAAVMGWNTMMNKSEIMKYGVTEKLLIPLNDYIEKYGVEVKNVFSMRPEDEAAITAPDGNIYGLPRFTECGHCMAYPKLWFNYQWLENLNLEEPQTTEELYNVLKAFKEQDPNGNGVADEVGITGCIDFSGSAEYWLMNSFLDCPAFNQSTDPRMFLNYQGGKVNFVANQPEYREGLEWMKKLYDEGLIDPANFTQNPDSLKQQVLSGNGTAVVGGFTCDHMAMGLDFNDTAMASQYHALPPVEGPNGVRFQPYNPGSNQLSGFNFVIFDTCEHPAAAYRLADWGMGEDMTYTLHYGMEGHGWIRQDGSQKNIGGGEFKCQIVELPADATEEEKDELASYRLGFLSYMTADLKERRDGWSLGVSGIDDPILATSYESRLEWETQRVDDYWPEVSLPSAIFMEEADAAKFSEIRLNINQCVVQNTSQFITGARSLDEWDAYCKELEQYGLEEYVKMYSDAYEGSKGN